MTLRPLMRTVGGSLVSLAACVFLLGSTAGRVSAAVPCWQRVIADWSANGRVDRSYPLVCYRQAVAHMPEDLRAYSSAPAEIDRALAERRVALPASARVSIGRPAASTRDATHVGMHLATLVPSVAGILAAAGVGVWLLRVCRRPTHRR